MGYAGGQVGPTKPASDKPKSAENLVKVEELPDGRKQYTVGRSVLIKRADGTMESMTVIDGRKTIKTVFNDDGNTIAYTVERTKLESGDVSVVKKKVDGTLIDSWTGPPGEEAAHQLQLLAKRGHKIPEPAVRAVLFGESATAVTGPQKKKKE